MNEYQKVIFYEGMLIRPHHFQQAERHARTELNARIRSVSRHDWGISELEVDRDSLSSGLFNLLRCRGVMPDGLAFNMPDIHPLPPGQNFSEHFEPSRKALHVYLTVPLEKHGGANCPLDEIRESPEYRFKMKNAPLADQNNGENHQEIALGLPNFQIRFGDNAPAGCAAIKIAHLIRQDDQRFVLLPQFIPASLHIAASGQLQRILRSLIGLLMEKHTTLRERRQRQVSGEIGFSAADIKLFWLMHTVNHFIPLLSHLESLPGPGCHPEELYMELLALAGQLSTFSADADLKFPPYEHDNLSICFNRMYEAVKQLLDQAVPPPNYVRIPLASKDGSLYLGRIVNDALFSNARFYLVVKGEFDERRVADEMPRYIKIASPEEIHGLAESAVQGVKVSSVSRPPVGPPSGPGLLYFLLDRSGLFWDNIRRSGAIAILFTAAFQKLKPMLIAVAEEDR